MERPNYEDYLVYVYFGTIEKNELVTACIRRAYRDFNRTLRGVSKVECNDQLYKRAECDLAHALDELKATCAQGITEAAFDAWHRKTCEMLILTYSDKGYDSFSHGQAQKWINMTLKYIFVLGESRVEGFNNAYPLCHAPLDNILLEALKKYSFPRLPCAWSRLTDYDVYLDRQKWIRNNIGLKPLDAEFLLWMGKEVPLMHGS